MHLSRIEGILFFWCCIVACWSSVLRVQDVITDGSAITPYQTIHCSDGSDIIYRWNFCDGRYRCTNGEDEEEELCRAMPCSKGDVKCKDGIQCISESSYCDGYKECKDGSDEEPDMCRDTECPEGYVKCQTSFQCIHRDWVCNDYPNCPDGSDESEETCKGDSM